VIPRPAWRLFAAAGWLTVFVLATGVSACARGPGVTIVAPDGSTRQVVEVEIAKTPAARELGLMYRAHLDEDSGMIFIFPSPDRLSFWMKNTEISLDMIFADRTGKIVGIVEDAEPYSLNSRAVHADSLYVLEVNGGFAKRHHVVPGDRLEFSGFVPETSQ
jgi:uncharacterized membrane protein (UPF0127 family)